MTATIDQQTELDRTKFFINGEWVDPRGTDTHPQTEAATGEVIGTAALGNDADIDAAVQAARDALDNGPWGRTTAEERAEMLHRFSAALSARADFTSSLVSRENGMPITLSAAFNGAGPAGLLQLYAEAIKATPLEVPRPSPSGASLIRREPVGVVGAITPWNYPQALAMMKIAPALAAGCTMVLKPSPDAALDSYVFADAVQEAGLPPGVLNIVLAGREAGASLVTHPGLDKVAFTGSTEAGRWIGSECGKRVRRVSLELGGKSAGIVLDDADLDVLVQGLGMASFMNNCQTCTTQSRILAPRSRYEEVVEAVAGFANDMVVGNPLDPATTCGPMASQHHLEKVLRYIDVGNNSDARLVAGGGRPKGMDRGFFVQPTVFADVDNNDQLAREEVFGPVIAVLPYETEEDAIRIANDSNYGLAGSVWTTDEARGVEVARRIRTGTIGVNYYHIDLGAPFGGFKESGLGREGGPEALDGYLEYKSIYVSGSYLNG